VSALAGKRLGRWSKCDPWPLIVELSNAESPVRSDRVRDLVGNPFKRARVDPSWRTPRVLALAEAAYTERVLPAGTLDGARLALLADALEEAGCDNPDILTHLRGPCPHVRGCWVVDLVRSVG
jgi:hypothetical protein